MKLRKIPLESFIFLLQELYEEGADFIDISGEQNENEPDVIEITIEPEYFFYEEEDNSFTEGDINDLI